MPARALSALFGAMLVVSHPVQARSLAEPPPFLGVSYLQHLCDQKFEQSADPASRRMAGECRGYIRAIVDRYFATEFTLKEGQIMPSCDWTKTTDLLIADVRKSVNGPVQYGGQSPAEPWLREMLSKRCGA
jgi:hypothetical protein